MSYKIRKILLAITDPAAKKSIVGAAMIARRSNARIELFSAVRPASGLLAGKAKSLRASRTLMEHRMAQLEGVARRLREDGITVSCKVEFEYSAADAILRRVKAARPDLVVIEAHKHNLLARLMLSQTDFELIRHCAVPLLIVKGAQSAGRPVILAALDPWHEAGKPAALDERIAEVAHGLSHALGGKLHAVHVHAPMMRYATDSVMAPVVVPVPAKEQKKYLAGIRRRFKAMGRRFEISAQKLHLRLGDPAIVLPELVRTLKVHTVVMGAVSRSVLNRVLIGSTAERVLDAMDCDVLIVKPKGFRTTVK